LSENLTEIMVSILTGIVKGIKSIYIWLLRFNSQLQQDFNQFWVMWLPYIGRSAKSKEDIPLSGID